MSIHVKSLFKVFLLAIDLFFSIDTFKFEILVQFLASTTMTFVDIKV
jgi:hypothetical protein